MAIGSVHTDFGVTALDFLAINDTAHVRREIQAMIGFVVRHAHEEVRRTAHESVRHRTHDAELRFGKYLIIIAGTQIHGPKKLWRGVNKCGNDETGKDERDA